MKEKINDLRNSREGQVNLIKIFLTRIVFD